MYMQHHPEGNNLLKLITCCNRNKQSEQHHNIFPNNIIKQFKEINRLKYPKPIKNMKNNNKLQKISIKNFKKKKNNYIPFLTMLQPPILSPTPNYINSSKLSIKNKITNLSSPQKTSNYPNCQFNLVRQQIQKQRLIGICYQNKPKTHLYKHSDNLNDFKPNLNANLIYSQANQTFKTIKFRTNSNIVYFSKPEITSTKTPTYLHSNSDQQLLSPINGKKQELLNPKSTAPFEVQSIESMIQKSKKLQEILQDRNQETSRASHFYKSKVPTFILEKQRKSQLEMIKLSTISKEDQHDQNNFKKVQLFPSLNPQAYSNFGLHGSQQKKVDEFGNSIQQINSFMQQGKIQQGKLSKINDKVEQSVVMHDFFNPAKILLTKWNGDKKQPQNTFNQFK